MCPEGTDITFSLEGRSAMADTGFYRNKEQWGNLPAGEACIAPLEGTAAGKIVIKKECFEGIWEDMTLIFDKGMVTDIRSTGKTLQKYQELLMQDNPHKKYQNRRNLAELGIGTNPIASNPLLVLEAEKIKGTVHLAIGTSAFLGGTVKTDIHQDFVIKKPTVKLFMDRNDEKGTVIMENGEWKI
jgi:leucyl aminopeptidase (aminopeptidase T)